MPQAHMKVLSKCIYIQITVFFSIASLGAKPVSESSANTKSSEQY